MKEYDEHIHSNVEVVLELHDDVMEKVAAEVTRALSDEEVHAAVAEVRGTLLETLERLQREDREGMLKLYNESRVVELYRESAESVRTEIDELKNALTMLDSDELTPSLDEETVHALFEMLSLSTVLIYPSWKFNEALSERAILCNLRGCKRDENGMMSITLSDAKKFAKSVAGGVRETTEQYVVQDHLRKTLIDCGRLLAAYFKEHLMVDEAVEWLTFVRKFEDGMDNFYVCLNAADRKGLEAEFKRLLAVNAARVECAKLPPYRQMVEELCK